MTSDLAAAIVGSLAGDRPQGQALLLLSDGIHNSPGGAKRVLESALTAKAMSAPISTTTIGGAAQLRDLEVALPREQELALVRQKVPLRATVRQREALAGESDVILIKDDREIARQRVQLAPGGTANVTFDIQEEQAGLARYEVRVPKHAGEATEGNNASAFVLRTIDRPIRVLLLEGKPYWDAKFLIRTLSQDAALELDAVVRVADGRFVKRSLRLGGDAASETASPAQRREESEVVKELSELLSAESLAGYQVIVLGRDAESFLIGEAPDLLRDWISREGGALVCYRGSPVSQMTQQLSRMMPVRWSPGAESRFRVQLTGRGQGLSWISSSAPSQDALARMPSLSSSSRPERPSALAVVLALDDGAEQPVISYQPYGGGRVVAIEGAGMWRWAFLAPQHQQHEPVYDELWRGLMRWLALGAGLAPGQNAALRADRVSYFTGENASATLLVREEATVKEFGKVALRKANGEAIGEFVPSPIGDEPGVYGVDFGVLPEGAYRAALEGHDDSSELTVAFDVRPNYSERLDIAARPDLLARIAEESGGIVLDDADGGKLTKQFREHLAASRPVRFQETTVWDRWWVLAAVVGLWGAAWGLRRARGLI
jgi:hypothetical protein